MSQLEIFRGDSKTLDVRATISRIPSSLVGLGLRFTAKRHLYDPNERAIIHLTDAEGSIVLDGLVVGRALITIPAHATVRISRETVLYWDLQVTDGLGSVTTVASGTLLVKINVSQ